MRINALSNGISPISAQIIPKETVYNDRNTPEKDVHGFSSYSDRISISDKGRELLTTASRNDAAKDENDPCNVCGDEKQSGESVDNSADLSTGKSNRIDGKALSSSEKKEVDELKERDREVKAHEQAHLSAAGNLAAGSPKFKYQKGPDGQQYAVAGEVGLKIPEGANPRESLAIAQRIERAALAPAEPSAKDRSVANQARRKAADAQRKIAEESAGKSLTTPGIEFQTDENETGEASPVQKITPENGNENIRSANAIPTEKKKNPFEIYNNIINPDEIRNSDGVGNNGIPAIEPKDDIDRGTVTFNLQSPRRINCLV